jgi:hypothetical protein
MGVLVDKVKLKIQNKAINLAIELFAHGANTL